MSNGKGKQHKYLFEIFGTYIVLVCECVRACVRVCVFSL